MKSYDSGVSNALWAQNCVNMEIVRARTISIARPQLTAEEHARRMSCSTLVTLRCAGLKAEPQTLGIRTWYAFFFFFLIHLSSDARCLAFSSF